MNLGQLPGYYFDAEKNKYFKIQANHVAPAGAKHAKSNVNREDRDAKKRRLEQRHGDRLARQTVSRPRIAQSALLSASSMKRELGNQNLVSALEQRDAAFVAQLHPERTALLESRTRSSVLDIQPRGPDTVLAVLSMPDSFGYYIARGRLCTDTGRLLMDDDQPGIAFWSDFVGIHLLAEPERTDTMSAVIAVAREPLQPGNVMICEPVTAGSPHCRMTRMVLGSADSSLWSSSLSASRERLVVSGTEALFLLDTINPNVLSKISLQGESRDVTWLDRHTIAFGHKDVQLWDVRSSGVATRFSSRSQRPLTGVHAPNRHGVQLLAVTNRSLELYDTRMGTLPVLSWPHIHQGPKLQFAVHEALQVVSAVDIEGEIQNYSVRSGKALGALQVPKERKGKGLLSSLRWLDDEDRWGEQGVVLQACQGAGVCENIAFILPSRLSEPHA
ncbi:hypothetical protein LTR53_014651 [Teratosphaeriaceae sp. CCFEE 6253]|nr:hypothetical protein LTR53_014651 [Teratosphaeriaceae sp. CCFEE 6253]